MLSLRHKQRKLATPTPYIQLGHTRLLAENSTPTAPALLQDEHISFLPKCPADQQISVRRGPKATYIVHVQVTNMQKTT
jgi:hypothetical protein